MTTTTSRELEILKSMENSNKQQRKRYEQWFVCLKLNCFGTKIRSDNRKRHCEYHSCLKCSFSHYKINKEAQIEQLEEIQEKIEEKIDNHEERIS